MKLSEPECVFLFHEFQGNSFNTGFFVLTFSVFAQRKNIDSILQVLTTCKEDTNKANTYHSLCWSYMYRGDYNIAKSYGDSALALSRKIGYQKGISWALNARGNVYKNMGDYMQALTDLNAS